MSTKQKNIKFVRLDREISFTLINKKKKYRSLFFRIKEISLLLKHNLIIF